MTTTTDVYSIAETSVDEILRHVQRGIDSACFRATSVGPRELSRLAELLDLAGYDAAIRSFSLLAGESQEPPWVISFPDDLALKIASMDDRESMEVASLWSQRSELVGLMSGDALRRYLDGLRAFIRESAGPFVLYVYLDRDSGHPSPD